MDPAKSVTLFAGILTFEDEGSQTRYIAQVRH